MMDTQYVQKTIHVADDKQVFLKELLYEAY